MKKTLFFAFALTVGALSTNVHASSDTIQIDGIWYILDKANHTATVTHNQGETSYAGRLIIPEYIEWSDSQAEPIKYPITAIGDHAFENCPNLFGITIPKTVQKLGLNLLDPSTSVTELKIEDGDETLYFSYRQGDTAEEMSFQELAYSCTYLYLGRDVEVLSDLEWDTPIFHTWNGVQNVVIGENVTEVPLAFCPYARELQTIQLNMSSVLEPGVRMFSFLDEDNPQPDAKAITLYVPAELVERYEQHAFWSRFTIEGMDDEKRYGIKFVESTLDFSKNGLYYQLQDDQYNHKHLAVVMPQVWYLNPDGSYVSQWSSEYPYKQSSVVIPDSVTFWKTGQGDYARYSGSPATGWEKYTYPVEIVGDYCFRGAKNLQSVTIPTTVYRIGTEVFEEADKLFSLTIPESVKEVGWLAFARCGLKEVVIPADIKDMKEIFEGNSALEHLKDFFFLRKEILHLRG